MQTLADECQGPKVPTLSLVQRRRGGGTHTIFVRQIMATLTLRQHQGEGKRGGGGTHTTFVGRVNPAATGEGWDFEGVVVGPTPLLSPPNFSIWLCCASLPLRKLLP